jgi:hypothetical protein
MSREIAAVEKITAADATARIESLIEESPKRRRVAQAEEEAREEAA